MEVLLATIFLGVVTTLLFTFATGVITRRRLPPSPTIFPIIGNQFWLRHSLSNLEPLLRDLRDRYGPIFTLHIGSHSTIIVADRHLAHKLLVQHGAIFANRPKPHEALSFISNNDRNINRAGYGPLWRLLRRNLMLEILHPSRIKLYSSARSWVSEILFEKLKSQAEGNRDGVVLPGEAFQHSLFCLLVFMCFGERLDDDEVERLKQVNRDLLLHFDKVRIFMFFPWIARYVFRKRWERLVDLYRRQREIYLPLIESRRIRCRNRNVEESKNTFELSYIDSLVVLEIPKDNDKKLTDEEIMGLCSEFLNAGSDTTSTALQWIMANVVKHPHVQKKLIDEINEVVSEKKIKEEDLQKMPYLKAVVLEGLRLHPPSHFLLPHTTTEDTVVNGYLIPRHASINVLVAEIGRNGKTWEDPLKFKPERFMPGGEGEGVDITGSREIKMMPFGAGRRICPGLNLALLLLEFFVANLVSAFEWKQVEGEEIDLWKEKPEFTVVMKNPLRATILPRIGR